MRHFYFPIWVTPSFGVVEGICATAVPAPGKPQIETSSLPECSGHRGRAGSGGIPIKGYAGISTITGSGRNQGFHFGFPCHHTEGSVRDVRRRSLGIYSTVIDPSQWQKCSDRRGADRSTGDCAGSGKNSQRGIEYFEKWLLDGGLTTAYNDKLFTRKHFQ